MENKNRVKTSFTLDRDKISWLKKIAEKNNRSMSNQIETFIAEDEFFTHMNKKHENIDRAAKRQNKNK